MDVKKLAGEAPREILAMEAGSSGTIAAIAASAAGGMSPDLEGALFDLDGEVVAALEESGVMLDWPGYDGMDVGEQRLDVRGEHGLVGSVGVQHAGEYVVVRRLDYGSQAKTTRRFFVAAHFNFAASYWL